MRSRLALRFAALGYLFLLLAAPVGLVFYRTFEHGFGPAWDAVTTPEAQHAFWLTMVMVGVAVPINTLFGVITAIVLVRHKFPGKALMNAAIDLPFKTEVSSVFIFGQIESDRVSGAAAVSVVLLVISFVVLLGITFLSRWGSKHAQ